MRTSAPGSPTRAPAVPSGCLMRTNDFATRRLERAHDVTTFKPQTERRLHNQIDRALRHAYAATTGLRILVGLSTREMLTGGASASQIREAFIECVRRHAMPVAEDTSTKLTTDWQREMLVNSMIEWADQVCASARAGQAAR